MDKPQLLETASQIAGEFLTQLGLDAEIVTKFIAGESAESAKEYLLIHFNGENLGEIIGFSGQNLDALQIIFALMISKKAELKERLRVLVDVNDYRESKEKQLMSYAKKTADEVRQSGSAIELRPMSPAERRIIHMVLKEEVDVKSESVGEGRDRRIVVSPNIENDGELF